MTTLKLSKVPTGWKFLRFIASSPKPEHEAIKNADTLFIPFDERLSKGNEAFAVRLGETDKAEFFNEWIKARTEDGWLKERYSTGSLL